MYGGGGFLSETYDIHDQLRHLAPRLECCIEEGDTETVRHSLVEVTLRLRLHTAC